MKSLIDQMTLMDPSKRSLIGSVVHQLELFAQAVESKRRLDRVRSLDAQHSSNNSRLVFSVDKIRFDKLGGRTFEKYVAYLKKKSSWCKVSPDAVAHS